MCNLYRMTKGTAEVARLFSAEPDLGANFGVEVYPGYPGLVVEERCARSMTWGFPLAMKGKMGQPLKPKPVNNAREDKLLTRFWRPRFLARRCLIPVSAWAEAEGERGRMTRTWHALNADDIFAVAGVWRPTAEWGDAYSMVMADGCPAMAEVHDRMPVILRPDQWELWVSGTPEEALELCRPWDDALSLDKTLEPWAKPRAVKQPPSLL